MERKYIIISDWQEYLCYWRSETPYPKWNQVSPRDWRYGNAANVCMYSPQMEQYLTQEGIRFYVKEN